MPSLHRPILALATLAALAACGQQTEQSEATKEISAATGNAPAVTMESPTVTNWMADLVRLRVFAANVRVGNLPAKPGYEPKIVGGFKAGPEDNPFQVSLLNKSVADAYDAHFCGGTLIGPNTVVTAAHCSDFVTAGQVQVLTGARKLDGTGQRLTVTRIAIHPGWQSNTNNNDVAVWRLESPAAGPFATLAQVDPAVPTELLATGWGALKQGGSGPVDLYRVGLPLVDLTDCNDANSYNGEITDRMICAGKAGGGQDTCQGDSGGPLTLGNSLVGVVSWGRGCAQKNFYGVYARVSHPEIRKFIADNS
jgi:secreted trypsin-like serine protease/predicted small lipoprotein YifL